MGVYKGKRKPLLFSDVEHHVQTTCGWRHVFEQLAGDALSLAMQAPPNMHVDCPLPSHGGEDDFRLMVGWDQPGYRAGKAICTCHPKGLDGFNILKELGLGTFKDVLEAVARVSGYLSDSSGKLSVVQVRKPAPRPKAPATSWTQVKADFRKELYRKLWSEAYRLDRPEAVNGLAYLENRGINLKGVLTSIRYHPCMQVKTKTGLQEWPALICRIASPNGQGAGLHRIFLNHDGTKAPIPNPKRFTPFIPKTGYAGCAARIVTVDDCDVLNVSEGPENTLVAYLCTAQTAWCTLDSTRMKELQVPRVFKTVRIWADNDKEVVNRSTGEVTGQVGQKAAFELADRLVKEGFDVEIMIPPESGVDWNDLFVSQGIRHLPFQERLPYARMLAETQWLSAAA